MSGPANSRDEHPGLVQRLFMVPGKIRARGWSWLGRRIGEICKSVTRVSWPGKLWRWILFSGARLFMSPIRNYRADIGDTLYVYYDLDVFPISYDIGYFLIWADLRRQRLGLKHLHLALLPFTNEETRVFPQGYDQIVDRHAREWRFWHIVASTSELLPSIKGVSIGGSRIHAEIFRAFAKHNFPTAGTILSPVPNLAHIYRGIIADLRLGSTHSGLQARIQARRYMQQWMKDHARGRKPVVITLRQYGVDTERNSNIAAWTAFARDLPQAYLPIFVPDTDHALESIAAELAPFVVFQPAAWNLELRMAFYEGAYLNLVVNSGPSTLCVLSAKCRYLMFKISVSNVHLASLAVLREYGFVPGETPPFCARHQKWVWEPDDADIIRREFNAMCREIEAAPAAV